MMQVTARLPDDPRRKGRRDGESAELFKGATASPGVEYYLDDFEDPRLALDRLDDPADPVLD